MSEIDTGDVVLHKPSGETWTVACVEGDLLSWCGWPEGRAVLSTCTLVKKATSEERQDLLRQIAEIRESDHRQRYASSRLASSGPQMGPSASDAKAQNTQPK